MNINLIQEQQINKKWRQIIRKFLMEILTSIKLIVNGIEGAIEQKEEIEIITIEEEIKQKNSIKFIKIKEKIKELKIKTNEDLIKLETLISELPQGVNDKQIESFKCTFEFQKDRLEKSGEYPECNPWNGVPYAIDIFLKLHVHDPSALKYYDISNLVCEKNGWACMINLSTKNKFGAIIETSYLFKIYNNMIVECEKLHENMPEIGEGKPLTNYIL